MHIICNFQDAYVKAEKKHEFVCEFTLDTRSIYAAVQKKSCQDLETIVWDQCASHNYTITLPEDQTGNLSHSWSTPEHSLFQIRGETFLDDHKKVNFCSIHLMSLEKIKENYHALEFKMLVVM